MPSHTKLKGADGTTASSSEKPDMLADHLEKTQWAKPPTKANELPTAKLFPDTSPLTITPFTIEELAAAQALTKIGKKSGPDQQAA